MRIFFSSLWRNLYKYFSEIRNYKQRTERQDSACERTINRAIEQHVIGAGGVWELCWG